MTLDEFRATKHYDKNDKLLTKHELNPALIEGPVPYFSDKEPLEQYLYTLKGFGYLIAKERINGEFRYSMYWGQGGTEHYATIEEAEEAPYNWTGGA